MPTPTETGYTWTDIAAWWGAGLATVVLIWNVIAWRTTERNTQARYDEVAREARIDVVFKKYMDLRGNSSLVGVNRLFNSGVATLKSHDEIIELADRIISHGQGDLLSRNSELFRNVDFKIFFDFVARERPSLKGSRLKEAVERSGAKKIEEN